MESSPLPVLHLAKPWLRVDLGQPHRIAGWPIYGPAWGLARHIAWLQVTDQDLSSDLPPEAYFRQRALADGVAAEIGLMTAADIAAYSCQRGGDGAMTVSAIVTAGLTNGESVEPSAAGSTDSRAWHAGTVNVLVHCTTPLSDGATMEAISLVAEARTAAILDLGLQLPDGRRLTGTGTDCILVAAPLGADHQQHCGLHTTLGRLIGETSYQALRQAIG